MNVQEPSFYKIINLKVHLYNAYARQPLKTVASIKKNKTTLQSESN